MILYVFGESHFDIDGYNRLRNILGALRPTILGIENTESAFKRELDAAKHPASVATGIANWKTNFSVYNNKTIELIVGNAINMTLLLGEYYQKGSLLFCDNPEIVESPGLERAINEYTARQDSTLAQLVRMTPEEVRKDVAQEYAETAYPVANSAALVKFYSERNKFAAEKLRAETLRLAEGVLVYVCGLDHIYGDYHPNLFDRLTNLNPKRMKLSEADKLPQIQ